ncbi:MAG: hypothetical protein HUN04_19200 [Desulfobacter sp.]|nr:MAG: hypothetical protein HUN04_19200 [Desulfobacter sp.]
MAFKICFRGDDRTPYGDDPIFTAGFQKRHLGAPIEYRTPNPMKRCGDITPPTAVCFSARLNVAAIFPMGNDGTNPQHPNYIYMMAVDIATIFNTHKMQVEHSLQIMDISQAPHKTPEIMWAVFAQEMAADSIPPHHIIAAVRFTRAGNWQNGGTYSLDNNLLQNDNCTVPAEVRNPALAFLRGEIDNHRLNQPLANVPSGFHASTGT